MYFHRRVHDFPGMSLSSIILLSPPCFPPLPPLRNSATSAVIPCSAWLFDQFPPLLAHLHFLRTLVLVVHLLRLLNRIEEADDEGGGEVLAGFDGALAELFDHADVAPLVA